MKSFDEQLRDDNAGAEYPDWIQYLADDLIKSFCIAPIQKGNVCARIARAESMRHPINLSDEAFMTTEQKPTVDKITRISVYVEFESGYVVTGDDTALQTLPGLLYVFDNVSEACRTHLTESGE